jgi:hypothetical protein
MSKPNVMHEQLALRRFATMRNRSNAAQAARNRKPCDCLVCQLGASGGSLADLVARARAEAQAEAAADSAPPHSKAH